MKQYKNGLYPLLVFACLMVGCGKKGPLQWNDQEILHQNQDMLTQIIIYDVFSPPVASRIYAYSSLASYEAIRFAKEGNASITEKLNGFGKMPRPVRGKSYNYTLAATKAFFTVVRLVKVFSVDSLNTYETAVYQQFSENLDDSTYQRSIAFGDTIAQTILARAKADGYIKSRGKAKYLGSDQPGKWRPTPPDYLDGVEWCWNTMMPLALDSASQFIPPRPPQFSRDTNSAFYKGAKEVFLTGTALTDTQKDIARFWDDNPFVVEHSGHLSVGNKEDHARRSLDGHCRHRRQTKQRRPGENRARLRIDGDRIVRRIHRLLG